MKHRHGFKGITGQVPPDEIEFLEQVRGEGNNVASRLIGLKDIQ